jgi:hypothetical protein
VDEAVVRFRAAVQVVQPRLGEEVGQRGKAAAGDAVPGDHHVLDPVEGVLPRGIGKQLVEHRDGLHERDAVPVDELA